MLPVHDLDVPDHELRFHRLSGRVSLDLVATIGERWRSRFERLRTPHDLRRWLLEEQPDASLEPTHEHLQAARHLRGAIEQLVIAVIDGSTPSKSAMDTVNEFAGTPVPVPHLETLGQIRHLAPPDVDPIDAELARVARDAAEVFGSDLGTRVRECEADDCSLVFLDTSRGQRRRWCSMQGCGNRAKVRRHRAAD